MMAPNSPRLAAKAVLAPATRPGSASGRVIENSRSHQPAPRVRAASSSPRPWASSTRRMARTWKGKVRMALASAAPVQRNTKRMPKWASRKPPSPARVPSSISSRKPVATGGSTSGRCTSPSSRVLPGKRPRASSSAAAKAKGRLTATATEAMRSDSSSAWISDGSSRVMAPL